MLTPWPLKSSHSPSFFITLLPGEVPELRTVLHPGGIVICPFNKLLSTHGQESYPGRPWGLREGRPPRTVLPTASLSLPGPGFYLHLANYPQKVDCGTSLVVQWLRICLPMQGTWLRALIWDDFTGCRATKSVCHNYWAHTLQGPCSATREATAMRSLGITTRVGPACRNYRKPEWGSKDPAQLNKQALSHLRTWLFVLSKLTGHRCGTPDPA